MGTYSYMPTDFYKYESIFFKEIQNGNGKKEEYINRLCIINDVNDYE